MEDNHAEVEFDDHVIVNTMSEKCVKSVLVRTTGNEKRFFYYHLFFFFKFLLYCIIYIQNNAFFKTSL